MLIRRYDVQKAIASAPRLTRPRASTQPALPSRGPSLEHNIRQLRTVESRVKDNREIVKRQNSNIELLRADLNRENKLNQKSSKNIGRTINHARVAETRLLRQRVELAHIRLGCEEERREIEEYQNLNKVLLDETKRVQFRIKGEECQIVQLKSKRQELKQKIGAADRDRKELKALLIERRRVLEGHQLALQNKQKAWESMAQAVNIFK